MADRVLQNYVRVVLATDDSQHTKDGFHQPASTPVALKKKFNPGLEEVS